MTRQIKEYLTHLEEYFSRAHTPAQNAAERETMLRRIAFYQHERIVHLLVMLGFAVFFLLALLMFLLKGGVGLAALAVLFLALLVPYIRHYWFLENSVQKMYEYFYRIERAGMGAESDGQA